MKESKKEVIIGGGAAGSFTALHLTSMFPELAEEIVLLEAKPRGRGKICAGASQEEKLSFVGADKKGKYRLLLHQLACIGFGNGVVDLEEASRIKITTTNSLELKSTSGFTLG